MAKQLNEHTRVLVDVLEEYRALKKEAEKIKVPPKVMKGLSPRALGGPSLVKKWYKDRDIRMEDLR